MKLINIIVTAILIKNVMHALAISVWYGFSKLFDSFTAFLESIIIELIKE
jgi:hypothetical protein